MKIIQNLRKQHYLLLLLVLIIGFYLRVDNIYAVRFNAEQDTFFLSSFEFINNPKLPLKGVEVSGLINADMGPFLTYFYAIPLLISKNPISVIVFSAILNTIGLFLCYLLTKNLFQKRTALITIALLSVNPFLIYYSRTFSNISAIFFFIMLYFLSAFHYFHNNKPKYIILIFFSIGCLLQIHILSSILILLSFLYFIFYKPKFNLKYYFVGITIFLLLFSPFIYYETTHNFENSINTLKLFTISAGIGSQSETTLSIMERFIFFNTNFNIIMLYSLNEFVNQIYTILFSLFSKIEELIFLLGLSFILLHLAFIIFNKNKSLIKNRKINNLYFKKYLFLVLWMSVPLLFFIFFKINVYPRYFIYLIPLQFIIIGYFLNFLIKMFKKRFFGKIMGYIIFTIILFIILTKIILLLHVNNIISKEGIISDEISLKYKFRLVSFFYKDVVIDKDIFNKNFHFIGLVEDWKGGFDSIFEYLYDKDRIVSKDSFKHYLLIQTNMAYKYLNKNLIYDKKYGTEKFTVIEYSPTINYSNWYMLKKFHSSWYKTRFKSKDWSEIDLPFYGTREMEELFLKGNIDISNKSNKIFLVVSTRACIENLYVNEKLIVNKTCTRGWRLEEISPFKYEIDITKSIKIGVNLIAMKLINIDKHFTVEIYDMAFMN